METFFLACFAFGALFTLASLACGLATTAPRLRAAFQVCRENPK